MLALVFMCRHPLRSVRDRTQRRRAAGGRNWSLLPATRCRLARRLVPPTPPTRCRGRRGGPRRGPVSAGRDRADGTGDRRHGSCCRAARGHLPDDGAPRSRDRNRIPARGLDRHRSQGPPACSNAGAGLGSSGSRRRCSPTASFAARCSGCRFRSQHRPAPSSTVSDTVTNSVSTPRSRRSGLPAPAARDGGRDHARRQRLPGAHGPRTLRRSGSVVTTRPLQVSSRRLVLLNAGNCR